MKSQELEAENAKLKEEVERLKKELDLHRDNPPHLEGMLNPCKKCWGLGRRAYGNTTGWRGGIGGQAITTDVCDFCWGTGDLDRKGRDVRKFEAKYKNLQCQLDKASGEMQKLLDDLATTQGCLAGTETLLDIANKRITEYKKVNK
jgi:peptidoglycan hydrolase CwlO-like protein